MIGAWLLLAGCGGIGKIGESEAPATTDSDTHVDTGWQVEEVPCAAPQPLSYRDLSAELPQESWALPTTEEHPEGEGGGVAWVEAPSEPMLVYIAAGVPQILRMESGVRSTTLSGRRGSYGLALGDLDGSGVQELIVYGLGLSIFWDFDGAPGTPTDIFPGGKNNIRDVSVADLDGDGLLDLLLGSSSPLGEGDSRQSYLVRGLGGRQFAPPAPVDVEAAFWGTLFDAGVLDVDGDAAPDVYLCNDQGDLYAPNGLLLNDGAGGLAPAPDPAGLDIEASCMGQAWGDLDGDGALDLVMGDGERIWLMRRDNGGRYYDASTGLPFGVAPEQQMLWGVAMVDADNNGYTDLVLPSSWFWVASAQPWPAYLYLQGEAGGGAAWTEAGARLGLPQAAGTRTALTPDLNGDGAPDLILGDGWRSPHVLVSEGCTEGAWVEVSGPSGSTVIVEAGGVSRAALITSDGSFYSARPAVAHIGLGEATSIDRIRVLAPWRRPLVMAGPIPARSRITAPAAM